MAESDRRLALLLSAYREPELELRRLAAIGDRLEATFRRNAPRRAWWRRPVVWAAAAVLACAVVAGGWALRPPPPPPATLAQGGGRQPMPVGVPVTISGGAAELRWADGTVLTLEDGVVIGLADAGDGAKRIRLDDGRIEAEIARQPAGRPLRIATAQSEITVRGTAFSVEADGSATRVAVSRGEIELRRGDDPVTAVGAGQIAVASADTAPVARPLAAMPLRNPGFELPLADDPRLGWCMDLRNNDSIARLVQDTHAQGRQALLLEQRTPLTWPPELAEHPDYQVFIDSPNGGRGHVSVSQRFRVLAGHAYRFAFAWRSHGLSREIRAPGPDRGLVKFAACLFWLDATGERCVPGQELLSTGDDAAAWTAWPPPGQAGRGRPIAPPDAVEAAISFKLTTAVAGRTTQVWVDDVAFAAE